MTEFQLTNDNANHLLKMISLTDKLEKDADGTLLYITPTDMTVCLYSVTSNVSYKLPIANVGIDQAFSNNAYACINVAKFKAALTKCITGSSSIFVRINHDKKSMSLSSDSGTSISVNCFDTMSDLECDSVVNYWSNKTNDQSFVGHLSVNITPEMLGVADTASKVITGDTENNVLVLKGSQLIYIDRIALVYKTLDSPVPGVDTYYLPKAIIDFIKPIMKETPSGINIKYSADSRYIYFDVPSLTLQVIVGVAELSCELPTDDEYNSIIPEDTNCIILKIKKDDIFAALSKFDGIFDISEYRWKQIYWTLSEESLAKRVVQLHYDDFTAEVDTTLAVDMMSNTSDTSDFSFLIPGIILESLISLAKEDEVQVKVSSVASNEWHGRGIEISTPTFKAVCTRFVE